MMGSHSFLSFPSYPPLDHPDAPAASQPNALRERRMEVSSKLEKAVTDSEHMKVFEVVALNPKAESRLLLKMESGSAIALWKDSTTDTLPTQSISHFSYDDTLLSKYVAILVGG